MRRLREILLTQYIGAIIVAFIACQGLINLVVLVTTPLRWYLEFRNRHTADIFFTQKDFPVPWDSLMLTMVNFLLYLLIAYALARWLYANGSTSNAILSAEDQADQGQANVEN